MRLHVKNGLCSVLGAALLGAIVSCGESGSLPSDAGTAADATDDALTPDDGALLDAGAGDSSVSTPPAKAETCTLQQVRCRGACFDAPGQKLDGCEVLAMHPSSVEWIRRVAFDDKHAFLVTQEGTQGSDFAVHHLDLTSKRLAPNIYEGFVPEQLQAQGGALYFVGKHEWSASLNAPTLLALAADGQLKPAVGALLQFSSLPFSVADGVVYIAQDRVGSNIADIYRMPLGAGVDSPFTLGSQVGAELVQAGASVGLLKYHAPYLYYAASVAAAGLWRVQPTMPNTAVLLNDKWSFSVVHDIAMPSADPDNLYFMLSGLSRVPRAGGELVMVPSYTYAMKSWLGPDELLGYGGNGERAHQLRALPYTGSEKVIDSDSGELLAAWQTADAYYAASAAGLVRIERN